MLDYVITMPTLLTVIGLVLVALEIAVFGFSTIFLIFLSIGFILTAILMFFGVLPETLFAAAGSVGVISLVAAVALWKPMRNLQADQQSPSNQPNVFKGVTFQVKQTLTKGGTIPHQYSGIEWQLVLEGEQDAIPEGTEVEVVKTAVGKLHVKPL